MTGQFPILEPHNAETTLSTGVLLKRIEELAIENSQLRFRVDSLQRVVDGIPAQIDDARKSLLSQMSSHAVNCGHDSRCYLAMQYTKAEP